MPKNTPHVPAYRLHKPSGLAVVRLNGKDLYLGRHGSAESQRQYEQVVSEWLANHRQLPRALSDEHPASSCQTTRTVNELFLAYWEHARSYYACRGQPTATQWHVRQAAKPLCHLFGHTPVAEFGPLRLKAVRQWMIDSYDWSRSTINKSVGVIKRMFKWGVENELVDVAVYQALATLSGLRRGLCSARETSPVKPAPEHLIWGVEKYVSRQVWALMETIIEN